jgi:hypothetical protein
VLLVPGTIIVITILWSFTTLTESTPVWFILVTQTVLSIGLAMSFTPLFTASLGSLTPKFYVRQCDGLDRAAGRGSRRHRRAHHGDVVGRGDRLRLGATAAARSGRGTRGVPRRGDHRDAAADQRVPHPQARRRPASTGRSGTDAAA